MTQLPHPALINVASGQIASCSWKSKRTRKNTELIFHMLGRGGKKQCQVTLEIHTSENNLLHDPEENFRLMFIKLFFTSFMPKLDIAPLTPRPLCYACSWAARLFASTLQTLVRWCLYSFHFLAFSNCSEVIVHCFYNNF